MNTLIERLIAAHQRRVNSAPRCLGHAGSMTDPALLNREIRRELARRFPDPLRLSRLKKERLAIKDRLFRHFPDAAEMRRLAHGAIRRARHA